MNKLWARREMDAPADEVWQLLVEPSLWPQWGPSVRSAELHSARVEHGATGTVTTIVGVALNFEITEFDDGASWAWKVAGIPATHHTVEARGPNQCTVGFGVPWAAAPYLAVCEVALRRLEQIATSEQVNQ